MTRKTMRTYVVLLMAGLLGASSACTQQTQEKLPPLSDPANLAGERVSAPALADDLAIDHGSAALEQLLRKLRTRASMMLIVAHPDDEDGGLLTLESRGKGARVAMLTLTRGEGGQNLMSGDFDDALGLIRTQELLAADRYMGVDQMFGTEVDFGFSKTKEESFARWTHDRVLYDAVRAVRLYRPLVLASVFVGGPTDGHGQHQVSGEITQEVFNAAADPNVFPEMLNYGLLPWAPLKVYARVPFSRVTAAGMYDYATGRTIQPRFTNYVTGVVAEKPPVATVTIHEGDKPEVAAFHGLSYVQWARQGLALQKTQIGPNVRIPPAGIADVGYTLMGSRLACRNPAGVTDGCTSGLGGSSGGVALPAHEDSIFEGIDTSLLGLAELAPGASPALKAVLKVNLKGLDQSIADVQARLAAGDRAGVRSRLRDELVGFDSFLANIESLRSADLPPAEKRSLLHELRIKRVQLNNALVLALGVSLRAVLKPGGNPGDVLLTQHQIAASVVLSSDSDTALKLRSTTFGLEPGGEHVGSPEHELGELAAHSKRELPATLAGVAHLSPTRPYFSRPNLEQPFYNVADPALRNAPATPAPLLFTAQLDYQGAALEVAANVQSPESHDGPATGVTRAAQIIPDLQIALLPSSGILTPSEQLLILHVSFTSDSRTQKLEGLSLIVDAAGEHLGGPIASRLSTNVSDHLDENLMSDFRFSLEKDKPLPKEVHASIAANGTVYAESFRAVGYEGLTPTNSFKSAAYRGVAVDVAAAPLLRVAYLDGTGDSVPQYLRDLGVEPVRIFPNELTPARLDQYDEVILGVRAYAAHPELEGAGSLALADFARRGGVVVVQYNSGGFNPGSAPYPYTLPGDPSHNVVEEQQPVRILEPAAPLLNWPNKITAADFNGWVAERGHGFAGSWAPQYEALLETHDQGQDPQKGGLLVAPVGKGAYIYCAFALYRQLPEAVPGAYRLFANLLSYAKNPGRVGQ